MPDLTPVESSLVAAVGYDAPAGTLTVALVGGRSYAYRGVPPGVLEAFLAAGSKGVFFNREVKPKYPCDPLP
ncbi:Uncharacterized protein OS=Pseudomonas syringae pv. morsprunorum str. M302280 GN=PSYMP_07178 PE=4 SV=1: KTSC [Gemmataceae bacterium]|nr:Uncharacterized protein OS=Pseudomonas syringae pv. morsprunorum str. M302280 GN=PSYMP_07178 PE=4 SV=1: KTSC [Gemmataceae bacterium]VTT96581.1 Uncharacterized protein OS=Pseudomonas syringae pv. morsprunorum str. M302280 GN=PSYMP_07178 PE=4 SV=1: KTSC [Gemmataceae bacterium]